MNMDIGALVGMVENMKMDIRMTAAARKIQNMYHNVVTYQGLRGFLKKMNRCARKIQA